MSPQSERKADELIRLLGALGKAQEQGEDPATVSGLTAMAAKAHAELATELA
jgi:hypothetical protein